MTKQRFFVMILLFSFFCLSAQETAVASSSASEEIREKPIYTYDDLLKTVYTQNTTLKSAREEYQRSLIDIKNAKAGFSPVIDFTFSGTYLFNPIGPVRLETATLLDSISWPAGNRPNLNADYIEIFKGMENTLYNFQFDITQPLFTWGKLPDSVKLYTNISEAQLLQVESKEAELEAELRTRLSGIVYLQQMKVLLEEQAKRSDRLIEISEAAERAGSLLKQDLLEAKVKAKEIDISISNIEDEIQNILIGLRHLTGIKDLDFSMVNYQCDEEIFETFTVDDVVTLEEKALNSQQETFKALEKMKDIHLLTERIAKSSVYWKPDIALKATLNYMGSRFPFIETDWYRKNDYGFNLSLGLKTTVWDGGKKLNEIKKAAINVTSANTEVEKAKEAVTKTLHENINAYEISQIRIEYMNLKVETLTSKVKQQELMKKTGYGSERTLLQAQIEKGTAEIELLQHKISRVQAYNVIQFLTE